MSVRFNNYIMRGVLCPYGPFRNLSEELEDEFDEYCDTARGGIHHKDGVCMLFDGMGGDYVAIGRVIAKSECGEGFGRPMKVDNNPLEDEDDLSAKIRSILEKVGVSLSIPLNTLVIGHYR